MPSGTEELLEFHSMVERNSLAFALSRKWAFDAMARLISSIDVVCSIVSLGKDPSGKTIVSLLELLSVFRRQALVAFELFSSFRAHQAWLLFRPGLEALLIGGKWLDDKATVEVWKNRRDDAKAYVAVFTRKALRSNCMPNSARLVDVLARLNDSFPHSNREYCDRHSSLVPADLGNIVYCFDYFDSEPDNDASLLAFLNVSRVALESLLAGIEKRLSISHTELAVAALTEQLRPRVDQLLALDKAHAETLKGLGLWS